jgi:hypothetical protein
MSKRLRLTESQVAKIAQDYFDAQTGSSIMRGLKVMQVRVDRAKAGQWLVLFSSRLTDGGVVDSPPAVLVDDNTATARFENS